MKLDNFSLAIIGFTLVAFLMWYSTNIPTWAIMEKMQFGIKNENVNRSNASAQVPSPILNKSVTIIKNDTNSYINVNMTTVRPGSSNHSIALCDIGDPLISGGYSLGLKNPHLAANISVLANHPTGNMTSPKIDPSTLEKIRYFQEGWEAGLLNNGFENVTIKAHVLCANVQK